MTATPTSELARFVAELEYEALPARIRERSKDLLLDALGSALAGQRGEETSQIRALAAALGASNEASVIGGGQLSMAGAVLLNGYLVTAVTVCDVHRPTLFHVTPEVVPPALAIAERDGLSGTELLVAVAAGLEVASRIAVGTNYPAFRARGWHSPGVIGPFGGAAAVGRLLGLDAELQRNAFALAGSQSAGTFAHWGTPTIKFHQCRGALSGLLAGLLAEQRFGASPEILTHPDGGLFNAYSDGGRPETVTEGLGERWELEQISLRLWPAGSSLQTVISSLFALIERHDLRPAGIARVRIGLPETVYAMHGNLPWDDKFLALLSTHYLAAVVLHDRRCWLEQFEPARYRDPEVDAFARERVVVEMDPTLTATGTEVEVTLADGSIVRDRRAAPKGDASDPLTRGEIQEKFRTAADGLLPKSATERILAICEDLEKMSDARDLLAGLRGAAAVAAGR